MLSLFDFLTAAPKTYVIKLHRREKPGEGLMQAAKVIQLVYDWILRPERVQEVLEHADVGGRHLLSLIYSSGDRGGTESELVAALEGLAPSQALMILGKLELEMLIYSREGEKTRTFHGFQELSPAVLAATLPESLVPETPTDGPSWISYRHFLSAHLCHFLSQVALGAVKITQSGEMHRKDLQELSGRFSFGEKLSSALPGEEVQFLLHFAADAGLILQEDGTLHLSADGRALLSDSRDAAWKRMALWWSATRLRGVSHALKALTALGQMTGRVSPWANLLWIHSGVKRKSYGDPKATFTWENLPKALQEFWMLGLIEFGLSKGRVGFIRTVPQALAFITESGQDDTAIEAGGAPSGVAPSGVTVGTSDVLPGASSALPVPENGSRPISLPNLESLVPLDSPFHWQKRLELVGTKSNDEFMARYHFSKESVIQGLQAGLLMPEFQELLGWLGFQAHARQTLTEWAATYASTLFMDALVLKVSDPVRLHELQEIPQFVELVTEIIPNYGFVLSRQNKPRVKELLQHFGLVPGEDSRRVMDLQKVSLSGPGGNWVLEIPEQGQPAFRETPGSLRSAQAAPVDKLTQASRDQDMATRIETLESAIAAQQLVEFSYTSPTLKRITLKPLLLLKHRDPIKLIGIETDTGHRNEYVLEHVKALRLAE